MQIYQIRNKINNKLYIGKSIDHVKRFKKHIRNAANGINRHLYDAINHYGASEFELILLEDLGECTEEYANSREIYWIEFYGSLTPNGYNMTIGGDGGFTLRKYTEEERQAMYASQAAKRVGKLRTNEQRQHMSDVQRGHAVSEKQRENISKTMRERGIAPPKEFWIKQGEQTRLNMPHTDETRKKLSEYRKGKKYSDLMDAATVEKLKNEKRDSWSGCGNPNYVAVSEQLKTEILECLVQSKWLLVELEKKFELSQYKLRQFFKEIGVSGYQKMWYNMTTTEWCNFWSDKLCTLKLK